MAFVAVFVQRAFDCEQQQQPLSMASNDGSGSTKNSPKAPQSLLCHLVGPASTVGCGLEPTLNQLKLTYVKRHNSL